MNVPKNVPVNLRFLCSLEGSISKACRVLDINRQQFNKYLAGVSIPSQKVSTRICDHFGVEDFELTLSPERFRALLKPSQFRGQTAASRSVMHHLQRLEAASGHRLREYDGLWFVYYPSFSQPGLVLKSLLILKTTSNFGTFESIERVVKRSERMSRSKRFRYQGLAFFLRERIFMVAYEAETVGEVAEMVLYPSYTQSSEYLHGLVTGCAAQSTRAPVSSRVVFQRALPKTTPRGALRVCGLLGYDDIGVPDLVRRALVLQPPDKSNLLRAFSDT